uniref:ABC transporter permease subunit n=1 Tax=Ignisphaera aggregans TaxID=334771 RepID=A0A7J3MWV5_9CREN
MGTVFRSIYIAGTATLLSCLWSIPLAYIITFRFRNRYIVEALTEAFVGIPTVVLGLLLYMLFSSSGPLGSLKLLYTPTAIIIGESILITPLIVSTIYRSLKDTAALYSELALSLGANKYQKTVFVLNQSISSIIASCIMGFSRAIGELGIAMMIGGNIKGYTRVMTTAIALEIAKGEFEEAIALSLILLLLTVSISIAVKLLTRVRVAWI